MIQRLTADDWARLRDLRLRSLRDAPDAFGSTYEDNAARAAETWRAQLESLATFVAVVDGADVGMVRGGPFDGDAFTAILLSMWVDPATRGAGVADALIDAVVGWARAAGYARMVLDVGDDNATAIALYARKGFAPTGRTGALPPPREHIREHERARLL